MSQHPVTPTFYGLSFLQLFFFVSSAIDTDPRAEPISTSGFPEFLDNPERERMPRLEEKLLESFPGLKSFPPKIYSVRFSYRVVNFTDQFNVYNCKLHAVAVFPCAKDEKTIQEEVPKISKWFVENGGNAIEEAQSHSRIPHAKNWIVQFTPGNNFGIAFLCVPPKKDN